MILIMPELKLKPQAAPMTSPATSTAKRPLDLAMGDAFRAALVLTGSIDGAELAMMKAIDALEPDCSRDALLMETVRCAVRHETLPGEWCSSFPPELEAISLLPETDRYCFVICILVGFDRDTCAEILGLSREDVEAALLRSLIDLPRAVETVSLRRQEQLEFSK